MPERPPHTSKKEALLCARKKSLKAHHFRTQITGSIQATKRLDMELKKRKAAERVRNQGMQFTLEKIALKAFASRAGLPRLQPQELHERARRLHTEKLRIQPFLVNALNFSVIFSRNAQSFPEPSGTGFDDLPFDHGEDQQTAHANDPAPSQDGQPLSEHSQQVCPAYLTVKDKGAPVHQSDDLAQYRAVARQ
ncbi:hypothetical protein QFC21_004223 [Naganishia friedmannii]|uniref:Uncharacterized protein n=1 Tax=Naganishia friedmannii TaxID=89922 RepID=A0ACC2VK98_9TREE|nr:hypothetical protein QFC21_004223 [Naganishia friedmannii]